MLVVLGFALLAVVLAALAVQARQIRDLRRVVRPANGWQLPPAPQPIDLGQLLADEHALGVDSHVCTTACPAHQPADAASAAALAKLVYDQAAQLRQAEDRLDRAEKSWVTVAAEASLAVRIAERLAEASDDVVVVRDGAGRFQGVIRS